MNLMERFIYLTTTLTKWLVGWLNMGGACPTCHFLHTYTYFSFCASLSNSVCNACALISSFSHVALIYSHAKETSHTCSSLIAHRSHITLVLFVHVFGDVTTFSCFRSHVLYSALFPQAHTTPWHSFSFAITDERNVCVFYRIALSHKSVHVFSFRSTFLVSPLCALFVATNIFPFRCFDNDENGMQTNH